MIYIKQKYNTDKQDFINRILKEYPKINMLVSPNSKSIIINSVINTPREIIKVLNDYVTEYNILLNKNGCKMEFTEFKNEFAGFKNEFVEFKGSINKRFDRLERSIQALGGRNLNNEERKRKKEKKKKMR